ncbi:MAG: hypothetical protein QXW39_05200, partial [Candidatus Bathyarchaeia archaeon]
YAVVIVYMVDSKRQKSISSDARDAYLKCALAVLRIGRELKKPLPELDLDAVSDSLEEIEEAAPLIENVPVEDISGESIEGVSQEGDLSPEELNDMVVTALQNVMIKVCTLINNIVSADLNDLENLGWRIDEDE